MAQCPRLSSSNTSARALDVQLFLPIFGAMGLKEESRWPRGYKI